MSLRLRIILTFAPLMSIAFFSVIWLIINDVRPRYLEAVEESVVDTAELVAAVLSEMLPEMVPEIMAGRQPEILSGQIAEEQALAGALSAVMQAVAQRKFTAHIYNIIKRDVALRIYVTDAKGILLYDSSGQSSPGADFSLWRDVYLTLKGQYGARSTRTIANDPASQVIFVAAPILRNNEIVGVVSVGKPTNSISFLIAIAQKRLLLGFVIIAIAAVVLSIALSHWITRPVRRLTNYAHAIRKGEKQSLPPLGSSEISVLGAAMEEMQTKLEGKNYIEDYVRALTHELKSPLTGIKGAGEILHDHVEDENGVKFLNIIDNEVDRLHSLVDRMLQLSRLENVRAINRTTFLAKPFCEDLANSFQASLAAKGLDLQCFVQEGLCLKGDALLLRQAVSNLVSNAIDFSPRGGAIFLSISKNAEEVMIQVRDQGDGMQDFALKKAFEKFFSLSRPDTGKKSIGLGLPFVAEIVSLHGGDVRLANIEKSMEKSLEKGPEKGLEATIRLPAATGSELGA